MTPEERRELEALRGFWADLMESSFEHGGDVEYSEFLAMGVRHGLLKVEDYDPDGAHEDYHCAADLEPGDDFYLPTGLAKAPEAGA